MIYNVIVLSSVTYALKAQGILNRAGINTKLEKLNKDRTLKGCGYGLKIDGTKLNKATAVLKNEKIRIVEIIDG